MKVIVKLITNNMIITSPIPKSEFLPSNNAGTNPKRIMIDNNDDIHGHKTSKSFLFI